MYSRGKRRRIDKEVREGKEVREVREGKEVRGVKEGKEVKEVRGMIVALDKF